MSKMDLFFIDVFITALIFVIALANLPIPKGYEEPDFSCTSIKNRIIAIVCLIAETVLFHYKDLRVFIKIPFAIAFAIVIIVNLYIILTSDDD